MKRLEDYDVVAIPCDRIHYDTSFNCRGEFTVQSVEDLSKSIIEMGRLLAPVWVQPAVDVPGLPEGFDYRLIAGHRRYKAVTIFLRWKEIPSTILTGLTERKARLLNFTENLERKDLNPLEEALAIGRLEWPDGMTQRNVAKELKRDTGWVEKRLWLLQMPEQVQQMAAARRITMLDLQIIRKRATPEEQIKVAEALASSKRGRGRKAVFSGDKLLRTFRRRRNKAEINAMIGRLLELGIETKVSATRTAAWCAGYITDDEFEGDLIVAQSENQNPSELY